MSSFVSQAPISAIFDYVIIFSVSVAGASFYIVLQLLLSIINYMIGLFLILLPLITCQVPPTWVTSPYVRAASQKVIQSLTGSNSTPTYTFTFSSPFSTLPNIAYGINKYLGDDGLPVQVWEVNRTSLTTSTFSVLVQIYGYTNIHILSVNYIAIDRNFPHHLNCFDNVPVNYSSGAIVNISVNTMSITNYVNIVNYTQQAIASGFSFINFSSTPTDNIIILFMTALDIQGPTDTSNPDPQKLIIEAKVLSNTTYHFNVTFQRNSCITKLHFSQIIFDRTDIDSSMIYRVVYGYYRMPTSGGRIPMEQAFVDNFIIGFVTFEASRKFSVISFDLSFRNNSMGAFEVYMPPSYSPRSAYITLTSFGFNIFYIKTWICPPNYVYDPSMDLCMTCAISGCLTCTYYNLCQICDEDNGLFLNSSAPPSSQCIPCSVPNCINCQNLTICLQCDESLNYFLNPTPTNLNDTCIPCSLSNCVQCSSLTACNQCDSEAEYFLNSTTLLCEACSLANCLVCDSLSSCLQCDQSLNYFVNPSPTSLNDTCIPCSLSNCIQCSSLTTCNLCNEAAGYFLNPIILLCETCSLANCLVCTSFSTCSLCDNSTGTTLNPLNSRCQFPNVVCGDNVFQSPEECDDGNTQDGDGCSNICQVESSFNCEPNTSPGFSNSVCFYVGEITMKVLLIQKIGGTNQIEIVLEIGPPHFSFWDSVDFSAMVILTDTNGFNNYAVNRASDGKVSILANYNTDIQNRQIKVKLDPTLSRNAALSRTAPMERVFPVVASNNQSVLFYDEFTYTVANIITYLSYAIAALSLLLFILGIFARKIIGVQMIAVVQISYLSLLSLSSMNPCFKALTNVWFINGFNYFSLSKGYLMDPHTPLQAKGIYLYSRFMQNYNFTLLLILAPYLISLICFILSKTMFKSDDRKQTKLVKVAKVCVCESAFNGVMFSGYIVAVSLILQFLYGTQNMGDTIGLLSIIQGSILVLVFAIYLILLNVVPQHFGEFVYSFKQKEVKKQQGPEQIKDEESTEQQNGFWRKVGWKWYSILMLERIIIGSSLVLLLTFQLSPIVVIGIFLLLTLLTIFRKPYLDFRHNVVFCANMLISIIIQAIYLVYKLSISQDNSKQKIWAILPLIVCVLLIVCVVYNVIFFIISLRKQTQAKMKMTDESVKEQLKTMSLLQAQTSSLSPKSRIINRAQQMSLVGQGSYRGMLSEIRKNIKAEYGANQRVENERNVKQIYEQAIRDGQYGMI